MKYFQSAFIPIYYRTSNSSPTSQLVIKAWVIKTWGRTPTYLHTHNMVVGLDQALSCRELDRLLEHPVVPSLWVSTAESVIRWGSGEHRHQTPGQQELPSVEPECGGSLHRHQTPGQQELPGVEPECGGSLHRHQTPGQQELPSVEPEWGGSLHRHQTPGQQELPSVEPECGGSLHQWEGLWHL